MLEPWIIEQIRRREEEERRREERAILELPVPEIPAWPARNESDERRDEEDDDTEPKRGVVIIGI